MRKTIVFALVFAAFLTASFGAEATITRVLPGSANVNDVINISLAVDVNENNKPSAYILRENIPNGFDVIDTGGGNYDAVNRVIKWLRIDGFLGQVIQDEVFSYRLRTNSEGTFQFTGEMVTAEGQTFSTQGQSTIQVGSGVDAEGPTVGLISPNQANVNQQVSLQAQVSDNTAVNSCTLFINGDNEGPMVLSQSPCQSCIASKAHTFTSAGNYSAFASCSDSSGNVANGSAVIIEVAQEQQQDTQPPVISNINAVPSATSAVITWQTNEPADSAVEYGLTSSYGSAKSSSGLKTSHSITLDNLQPNTLYHFRVLSKDGVGNLALSNDQTFTTVVMTSSKISSVRDLPPSANANQEFDVQIVVDVNENDKPSSYILKETIPAGMELLDNGGGIYDSSTRELQWRRIESKFLGTEVHDETFTYRVRAQNPGIYQFSGVISLSDGVFEILGDKQIAVGSESGNESQALAISNVQVSNIASNSALITWQTNKLANSTVEYGTTTSYGSTKSSPALVTNHAVLLTGLQSNTLYHFRIKSITPEGESSKSSDFTFTTLLQEQEGEEFPINISLIEILNSNFEPASSIPKGSQYHVRVKFTNLGNETLSPLKIIQVMRGNTPIHIATLKVSINPGNSAELTAGFNLPLDINSGETLTVKVFSWNQWITQQGNWKPLSDIGQKTFNVV